MMFGISRFAVSAGSWLAAMALGCAMVALSPDTARAQTADNLKCKKCVGTKDIDRKAVAKSRIKSNAVTFGKLHPKVESAIRQDRTFYVTLDSDGEEATLASQGPLRMFARCLVNDAGQDRVQIVHTSTANGWFVLNDLTERSAGEEVIAGFGFPVPTGNVGSGEIFLPGAVAPDGSTIKPATKIGQALNTFGHSCLVFGAASAFAGTP